MTLRGFVSEVRKYTSKRGDERGVVTLRDGLTEDSFNCQPDQLKLFTTGVETEVKLNRRVVGRVGSPTCFELVELVEVIA